MSAAAAWMSPAVPATTRQLVRLSALTWACEPRRCWLSVSSRRIALATMPAAWRGIGHLEVEDPHAADDACAVLVDFLDQFLDAFIWSREALTIRLLVVGSATTRVCMHGGRGHDRRHAVSAAAADEGVDGAGGRAWRIVLATSSARACFELEDLHLGALAVLARHFVELLDDLLDHGQFVGRADHEERVGPLIGGGLDGVRPGGRHDRAEVRLRPVVAVFFGLGHGGRRRPA